LAQFDCNEMACYVYLAELFLDFPSRSLARADGYGISAIAYAADLPTSLMLPLLYIDHFLVNTARSQ
jgi:hypothetical protein